MDHIFSSTPQSERPKKQGSLYSLDIGKNMGPFLPKDIMPNNPRSIGLLVGKQIVKSHLIMVRAIENTETKMKKVDENLKQSFRFDMAQYVSCTENLIDFGNYLQVRTLLRQTELKQIHQNNKQLIEQQRQFKSELDSLQTAINLKNTQNVSEIAPLLRQLYNRVKQSFTNEKNQAYKLTRELETINCEKNVLIQQVVACEGRIKKLEALVGVNRRSYNQLDSSIEEDADD